MRRLVKSICLFLAIVLTSPCWILVRFCSLFHADRRLFLGCAQLLSMAPGISGVYLRRGFYVLTLESCGNDCFIEFGTWFSHRQTRLGSNVYLGGRCTIGMADIGDNVLIGSNVDVLSGKNQHQYSRVDLPIKDQGGVYEQIRIGEDCWIGNSAVIVAHVGARSIIGAGSVVVSEIPESSIAAGNPATVRRQRQ